MAKCMMCGGAKKTPKALPKKMAKGGSTANKLNNARGFATAQKGGSNTKMMIYGIPNAGMTGPNRNSQTETMKKGGAKKATTKKPLMKKGGSVKKALTKAQTGRAMTSGPFDKATTDYLNTKYPGTAVRIPRDPEYYAEPQSQSDYTPMAELEADDRRRTEARMRSANNREDFNAGSMEGYRRGGAKKAMMKRGGAKKAKFGASVPVKHSPPVGMRHKDSRTGFESVDSKKVGGSLKPVPAGKVGLSKLPTTVRNKMGYQKSGGMMKKANGGPILDKIKEKLKERKITRQIRKSVKNSGKVIK